MAAASPIAPTDHPARTTGTIVYFDGVCGMCNQTVDFLMKIDSRSKLLFAPLQGETAQKHLPVEDVTDLKSLVVTTNGRTYRHSSAVIRILNEVGGSWKVLAGLLWIIPRPVRDLGYRIVSRYRYRIFGKKEACRLPTPEERARFLP